MIPIATPGRIHPRQGTSGHPDPDVLRHSLGRAEPLPGEALCVVPFQVVVGVDDGGWTMNPPSVLTLLESAALRKAIGVHLSLEGYAVTEAQTVPAVVAVLDRGRVDVVIVGYAAQGDADVVDLLRRLSATHEAPVILITDSAAVRQLPTDALPAVAEVFVRGRFSIAELKRFVAHAVTKP